MHTFAQYNVGKFATEEFPFLQSQAKHWAREKPLTGLSILHNIPLTNSTLLKLYPLVLAGAKVSVTNTKFTYQVVSAEIAAKLDELQIPFYSDHQQLSGTFDIGLDCCAELFENPNIQFTKGIVELTQSGGERLKNADLSYPCINIDDSSLKGLECIYGTGDGFLRALKALITEDLSQRSYYLFGFGKVGKGIAKALTLISSDITIIDSSDIKLAQAQGQGFNTISTNDFETLARELPQAFCLITATGCPDLLTPIHKKIDLSNCYIANMGADDEIGSYQSPKVLNNGVAINFSLKTPTQLKYLDPIFYAHNLAASLLLDANFDRGYHAFPKALDNLILDRFELEHHTVEDIFL